MGQFTFLGPKLRCMSVMRLLETVLTAAQPDKKLRNYSLASAFSATRIRGSSYEDSHPEDVALFHDEQVLAIDLHLGA